MTSILQLDPQKETAAFDVEGTLTRGAAWEGIRAFLISNGQASAYNTLRRRILPRYLLYRLNIGDTQKFKEDWVAGLLALMAGRSEEELRALGREIVRSFLWPQRREDVLSELSAQKTAGRQVVLVSGQFQPFLDAFVETAGADLGIGTAGIWASGRFTGHLAAPFTTGEQKVTLLCRALNGSPLGAAYGDTAADAPLLAISEEATAVYPDSGLRRIALERGWRVLD